MTGQLEEGGVDGVGGGGRAGRFGVEREEEEEEKRLDSRVEKEMRLEEGQGEGKEGRRSKARGLKRRTVLLASFLSWET